MIGLIPCLAQAVCSSTAPFMTPWSVSASAGCPNAAARSASSSILHAPSSSEYSEWTWRWAQGELGLTATEHRWPGGRLTVALSLSGSFLAGGGRQHTAQYKCHDSGEGDPAPSL